ncbi:MAG: glycosyltransferase family 2 protein [bacterium]|nr:MAG: glycosyltransferase family 2 protein [bacterium]
MLIIIFFLFVFIILYVYFGYPLIILTIAAINKRTVQTSNNFEPTVSLIIAAYNEEDIIEEKIKNSLLLDYAKDRLEIMVFSDTSTDRTDDIVKQYQNEGIRLIQLSERKGKTAGQNLAVTQAKGEIIIFSDANALYRKDAIRKIVRNFYDQSVGCVCGELVYYSEDKSLIGDAENVYWNYEKFIKRQENRAASILGANGSIYALRKKIFVPLPEEIISDFIEPFKIIEQGYRIIYEPEALSFEQSTINFLEEYRRKKRIISRSFYSLFYYKTFLNPLKYPLLSFQLISHKLLRWLIPIYLPIILVINLFLLNSLFFQITFGVQILFYATAILGYLLEKKHWHSVVFYAPFYYCLVNIASLQATVNYFIKRKKVVTWKPIRLKKS